MIRIIGFIFVLLLPTVLFGTEFSCSKENHAISEENVRQEIEKSNYCEIDSDCTYVNVGCPFGCNVVVNKFEKDKLLEITQKHRTDHSICGVCAYECIATNKVKCVNKKCIAN